MKKYIFLFVLFIFNICYAELQPYDYKYNNSKKYEESESKKPWERDWGMQGYEVNILGKANKVSVDAYDVTFGNQLFMVISYQCNQTPNNTRGILMYGGDNNPNNRLYFYYPNTDAIICPVSVVSEKKLKAYDGEVIPFEGDTGVKTINRQYKRSNTNHYFIITNLLGILFLVYLIIALCVDNFVFFENKPRLYLHFKRVRACFISTTLALLWLYLVLLLGGGDTVFVPTIFFLAMIIYIAFERKNVKKLNKELNK